MRAADDKDTFAERLIDAPRAVFRWASLAREPGEQPRSPLGCLNPLSLLKIIVGLLFVILLPLYMLPLLLVRLATLGRSSVRYGSVIDMTSGEQARWGHGALDPVPDLPSVQAGAAAIAAHDPEFDPAKLLNWAMAATELIRLSLTTGDATPARTFMANGLFRTYQALLELRGQGAVTCEGSWECTRATLVDALSTPLVDEVRVRLTCTGWCWDRHASTGLTLRGSPDVRTWSEDLTFGRSASAISPAAGGLPAKHCPSCGARSRGAGGGWRRRCPSEYAACSGAGSGDRGGARSGALIGIRQIGSDCQLRDAVRLDEVRSGRQAAAELQRNYPGALRSQHWLYIVRQDRPGGGHPEVIGAVQVELAMLMHVAAEDKRGRLVAAEVRYSLPGRRRQEPVRRRGS
jgi:hypothetical protein